MKNPPCIMVKSLGGEVGGACAGGRECRPRAMLLPSTCPLAACRSRRRHLGRVRRQAALAPADTSDGLLHQCRPRPLRAPGRPARSSGRPWPGRTVVLALLETRAEPVTGDGLPAVKVRTCDSSPRADASRLGARSVVFSRWTAGAGSAPEREAHSPSSPLSRALSSIHCMV